MLNGITSVKSGAQVTGTVEVRGNANDPSFSKWQLDLLPNADPNAPISLAVESIPGEFSYMLNTTSYPDGGHALRLRVVRLDSNYDEYVTSFSIVNLQFTAVAAAGLAAPTGNIRGDSTTTAKPMGNIRGD